jgi:hypothetical protein
MTAAAAIASATAQAGVTLTNETMRVSEPTLLAGIARSASSAGSGVLRSVSCDQIFSSVWSYY